MGVRYIFGQDGAFRTEPVIVAKNITENGTYDPATEGADGYAPVTVNVEGGGSSWQTVFEGSVTTVEEGGMPPQGIIEGLSSITADPIKITLNGVEYTCNFIDDGYAGSYGAQYDEGTGSFDFSEYPFNISNRALTHDVAIVTQTAGTYTLKIEEEQSGGGDFSTAEVTIMVDAGLSDGGGLNGGIANLSEGYGFLKNSSIVTMAGALAGETINATAILIEGEAIYSIVGGIVGNTTGGVSYDSENDTVKVIGDGSITITFNQ